MISIVAELLQNNKIVKRVSLYLSVVLLTIVFVSGCGGSAVAAVVDSNEIGARDATPKVLKPEASGTEEIKDEKGLFTIDVSNKNDGYFMVKYNGDNPSVKIRVENVNGIDAFLYDLMPEKYGEYEVFSFPLGSGSYKIGAFESHESGQFLTIVEKSVDVSLADELKPFLYPIQIMNFSETSNATVEAARLAKSANTELEVIQNIFAFVVDNVKYDEEMAQEIIAGQVSSTYVPDPDKTLASLKGICYDYASLMGAMLRSQGIPTKLVKGMADGVYHAWLLTYSKENGTVSNVIKFDGTNWSIMDPTFSATSGKMADFVGSGTQYDMLYVY